MAVADALALLHRVRRTPNYLQFRPAVDWISSLARAASATSQRYYVASAKSVEVRLNEAEEGRTLVEFVVDPGTYAARLASPATAGAIGAGRLHFSYHARYSLGL